MGEFLFLAMQKFWFFGELYYCRYT